MATIKTPDGQLLEDYPDDIAADDQMLKDSLVSMYPEIGNAKFRRYDKNGTKFVDVIKQAGTKGGAIECLIAAPESLNPAITLHWKLQRLESEGSLTAGMLLVTRGDIEKATEAGLKETKRVKDALRVLIEADAQPAIELQLPAGF